MGRGMYEEEEYVYVSACVCACATSARNGKIDDEDDTVNTNEENMFVVNNNNTNSAYTTMVCSSRASRDVCDGTETRWCETKERGGSDSHTDDTLVSSQIFIEEYITLFAHTR